MALISETQWKQSSYANRFYKMQSFEMLMSSRGTSQLKLCCMNSIICVNHKCKSQSTFTLEKY